MKKINIILGLLLLFTACDNDLEQFPPNIASSSSLTDFGGVLNGAYYYQLAAVTPMAVMGDFRADNAHMTESPYTQFDQFTPDLVAMNNQFFGPFYSALYKSILSANNVIENSKDAVQVGEAKFVRALSVPGTFPKNLIFIFFKGQEGKCPKVFQPSVILPASLGSLNQQFRGHSIIIMM